MSPKRSELNEIFIFRKGRRKKKKIEVEEARRRGGETQQT